MNVRRDAHNAVRSALKYMAKACDIDKNIKTLCIVVDEKGNVTAHSNNDIFEKWIIDDSREGMMSHLKDMFVGYHPMDTKSSFSTFYQSIK